MNTSSSPNRPNPLARYLAAMLFGLVIGAIATVMVVNALRARQDPFGESLMHVQGWHAGALKRNVTEGRCDVTDTLPHIESLRSTSRYLEQAFPDLADDDRFKQAASGMRTALNGAHNAPPLNCAGVSAMNAKIDEGCKACHRDFKG